MKLFQFTDSGQKQFKLAYDKAAWAINQKEDKEHIDIDIEQHLFEENIKYLDSSIELPKGPFKDRYDFAVKLHEVLKSDFVEKNMFNQNLWSGLACYYFKQLCMNKKNQYVAGKLTNKLGEISRIILNTSDNRRIYRHLVWGPVRVYYYCGDSAKKLLSKALFKPGEEYEQIVSRRHLLNPAGLDICNKIGWDSKRKSWIKNFGTSKEKPWAVRNIAVTLDQLAVNYSIPDCESKESQNKLLKKFPANQLRDHLKLD